MWKLLVASAIFAAFGLYVLKQPGADIDMGGEKHDVSGGHADSAASAPALVATPASAAASQ